MPSGKVRSTMYAVVCAKGRHVVLWASAVSTISLRHLQSERGGGLACVARVGVGIARSKARCTGH